MLIEWATISIPFISAALTYYLRSPKTDKIMMIVTSVIHLLLTLQVEYKVPLTGTLVGADSLSYLFLLILSTLFAGTSVYNIVFIVQMQQEKKYTPGYVPVMMAFLGAMSGVILSRNLGMMWVFIELTTLVSAPLIWYYRTKPALEALWKYLFICSVGIAFAFIGIIMMIKASAGVAEAGLNIDLLQKHAGQLSPLWGGLGFLFALVGYGTKMGLAPMHTWLPDAHSQAPSPASAMFSGSLLNCAFLAILRYYQIFASTPIIDTFKSFLIALGLISVFVCAVYVVRTTNFKRKLAYSSVEHMGILAIAMGLGKGAIYGALLHALCHSLTKHMMFLTAGNFFHAFNTIETDKIKGALKQIPLSAWLLIFGVFALTGTPPFGMFISKFIILKGMLTEGRWVMFSFFVILLAIVSYALIKSAVAMSFSEGGYTDSHTHGHEPRLSVVSQWMFIALLVAIGLHIPAKLDELLKAAAALLGGGHG